MAKREVICVKVGGRAASETTALTALIREIASRAGRFSFVVIHGGGAEVTRVSEALGMRPEFRDGVRMTSPAEMDVVDMVLCGKMNKAIVRRFQENGVSAVGLSGSDGGLLEGKPLAPNTRTGTVTATDPRVIAVLLDAGYTPVIASPAATADGIALNINADEAALAVAGALSADLLLFLSDIPGILDGNKTVSPVLDERRIEESIEEGVISGGMIPKVRSSLAALHAGVRGIVIGQYQSEGDLARLMDGTLGSRVVLEARESRSR